METSRNEVPVSETEGNSPWNNRSGALRVLITGANGFVGRHLIAHLVHSAFTQGVRPIQIFAGVLPAELSSTLSTRPDGASKFSWDAASGNIQGTEDGWNEGVLRAGFDIAGWTGKEIDGIVLPVGVELSDKSGLMDLVGAIRPHRIYHLAARSSGADTDRDAVFAVNVEGTRCLLEAAATVDPFPRVLVASTGYVYGDTLVERPAREDDPIGPLWKYGAYTDSKIEMESVARAYRGFVAVVRSFAHTGPGQAAAFALPGFAQQIATFEREGVIGTLRVGNLSALRDLMDVRDVVIAYHGLLEAANWETIRGNVFNVATGCPVKMADVVGQLCGMSRQKPLIEIDPARLRALDISCSTGDSSRIERHTGWRPSIPLEQTLRDLLDYWRNR